MNVFRGGFVLFIFFIVSVATVSSEDFLPDLGENDEISDLPRYVVFPGLDADGEEIAEWNVGFASPFNVFFGPKPYILGWMGEGGFAPIDEGDEDYLEGEDGEFEEEEEEEEGEEAEGEEVEEGEVDPDYDYEKA